MRNDILNDNKDLRFTNFASVFDLPILDVIAFFCNGLIGMKGLKEF